MRAFLLKYSSPNPVYWRYGL